MGEPDFGYKMNHLSFRNNWLKFKTSDNITNHFRGIYGINLESSKTNLKMSCNLLDLETLGS